jgi:hypothetical protein
MNLYTLLYYLLLLILVANALQGLGIGGLYFFKRSGEKRANYFYGILLIAFSLTVVHNIFLVLNLYELHPQLKFLPIYFTLAFPTLIFYHVKLALYPGYKLRLSDAKHFILPVGQFIFFVVLFFSPLEYKKEIGRQFFNPFFGAFEQFLYLVTFYAYLYFAYRYIIQRQKTVKVRRELRLVLYLKKLIKILLVLFAIHTVFVLTDFVCYEFLGIDLRVIKIFAGSGILSFAALNYWLSIYGFQVLFWGRKRFYQ